LVQGRSGHLYCGVAVDVERRVEEHNTSLHGSRWCRAHRPVRLVWQYPVGTRSEAQKAEALIKKLSRADKLALLVSGDPDRPVVMELMEFGIGPSTCPNCGQVIGSESRPVVTYLHNGEREGPYCSRDCAEADAWGPVFRGCRIRRLPRRAARGR